MAEVELSAFSKKELRQLAKAFTLMGEDATEKAKIVSYDLDLKDKKLERKSEYIFNDEILNFHINKDNIIIIGKNNKSICQFNNHGMKLSES